MSSIFAMDYIIGILSQNVSGSGLLTGLIAVIAAFILMSVIGLNFYTKLALISILSLGLAYYGGSIIIGIITFVLIAVTWAFILIRNIR